MKLHALCDRYDELLRTDDFADVDASANGLQLGPDDAAVEHVAFAVDAAVETVEQAVDSDADLLCVHHGLSWGGIERITGRTYERIAGLIENELALYVSHLPLDAHPELGNAAGVGDVLGLAEREPFGSHGPEFVGQCGTIPAASPAALRQSLERELDHGGRGVQLLDFGPDEITDVAIVTGSGVDFLDEAVARDADVLITGEGKQHAYHQAKESGIHVVLAGHYATETFGVRSLQSLTAEWGLETTFVDAPTGL